MKIFALTEGSYSVDNSKNFIPFKEGIDDPKSRPASLFIYVQPFLVKTDDELLLLDTGLGYHDDAGIFMLHKHIEAHGFSPGDVTKVLMSHLHFDHAGGMIQKVDGKAEISFPNAEYIIQRGEWENAYNKPSKSYQTAIFDILQRSGNFTLVEGNGKLTDDISYELTGGHTEYHQVFTITNQNETVFYGGDVLPEPEQLMRKFIAKYDFDGRKAMELRNHYGKLAVENNWTCLFYHAKNRRIGKVLENENGFKVSSIM